MESIANGLIQSWGITSSTGAQLVSILVMLGFSAIVLLGFFLPFAGITSWLERRIAGRMQCRPGPNVNGPQGFLQWIADGIKAMEKEDLMPNDADAPLFKVAPYFVFMGVAATLVAIPFTEHLILADLNIGVFYIIAVTSFVTVGILLAGWSSNNKWSLIGGVRSASQMISYEIPTALSVLTVVLLTGSMSMQDIVKSQGFWPWQWHISNNPFMIVMFFIFFISALAEGSRTPFDLPEAESELVSGYNTEYSSIRFALFFLAEWGNLFVIAALTSILFLGGWQAPASMANSLSTTMLTIVQFIIFMTKMSIVVFIVIQLRWTLPRVRVDQLMIICWHYFVPLSLLSILGVSIWMAVSYGHSGLQIGMSIFSAAIWLYFVFLVIYRAVINFKKTGAKLNLNFLE
jgi:NADH-quinone oxidoreductase subunit H